MVMISTQGQQSLWRVTDIQTLWLLGSPSSILFSLLRHAVVQCYVHFLKKKKKTNLEGGGRCYMNGIVSLWVLYDQCQMHSQRF